MNDERTLPVSLDKLCEACCRVYFQGLEIIGHAERSQDEELLSRDGWSRAIAEINDLGDGEHAVKDLANAAQAAFMTALALPADYPWHPGEDLCWEAVVRFLAAVLHEGELDDEYGPASWFPWIEEKWKERSP